MSTGDCSRELFSQHFLGPSAGHGPVHNEEILGLAVFGVLRDACAGLIPSDLQSKRLRRSELSVARLKYTTRAIFLDKVVRPEDGNKRGLLGIATALTQDIRGLTYVVEGVIPKKSGRALCVLDIVVEGDYEGHAAFGYSESMEPLKDGQKSRIRLVIQNDLIRLFGCVKDIDKIDFAPSLSNED